MLKLVLYTKFYIFKLSYILAYKLINFGQNQGNFLLIRLIRGSQNDLMKIYFYSFFALFRPNWNGIWCFINLQFWTLFEQNNLTSTYTRVDLYFYLEKRKIKISYFELLKYTFFFLGKIRFKSNLFVMNCGISFDNN